MPASVYCNMRTVVHKSSGDTSFAFPDVCKTPGPAIPIPYPNIAQSAHTANGAPTVSADGNPIMVKDSHYATSTGDEGGTAGGNVVTNVIKGKAYFVAYSFDVKADGRNVCRFLDPMTHNHSSSPPPGTPPGPDVGGTIAMPTQVDIKPERITARVTKLEMQSGIPMMFKGIKRKGVSEFAPGELPPAGKPHWERQPDGSPPAKGQRYPATYTIEGGGSEKKLRVDLEITEVENISGEAELLGRYLDYEIRAKRKVALAKGSTGWTDCEFVELPRVLRYEPGAGIQWFLEAGGREYPIGQTKIEYFFIYAMPKKPWGGKKLWYEALKYAFESLSIKYLCRQTDLLKSMTRGLHGCGLRYDTRGGRPLMRWDPDMPDLKLSLFLRAIGQLSEKWRVANVNCYDMAGAIIAFGSLIGLTGVRALWIQAWHVGPPDATGAMRVLAMGDVYGFIKPTFLVGVPGACNNPFFSDNGSPQMISEDDSDRTSFDNHAFAIQGRRVYDACAGPYPGGGDVKVYTTSTIDARRTARDYKKWSFPFLWAQSRRYGVASVS